MSSAKRVVPSAEAEVCGPATQLSKKRKSSLPQIKGIVGLAATRLTKLFESLRSSGVDVGFRQLVVDSPDGAKVQVYINKDKSPQQICVETNGKRLRAIIGQVVGQDKEVGLIKQDGQVSVAWHPCAKIGATAKQRPDPLAFARMRACGVSEEQREDIRSRFTVATGRIPAQQWSI